ncbi:MAG TPA: G/U mismatch-specific DNA glycosylase [Polyangiaceae bacterium]|nr:G/U mismatch-specific DNA glycosylase [Polyangiaceae bacterium]
MPRRADSTEVTLARPSPAALKAAVGSRVPDLIAPDLRVLFCGINPSLYSAVVGHHFARPGNRFWPTIHRAGFTERLLRPNEERELLERGVGITNVCSNASASADTLTPADYASGGAVLRRKLRRYRPRAIAFLGLGAYRIAACEPKATVGLQPEPFAGVAAWALPNPSGLNAHYQIDALVACYRALAEAVLTP